MIAQDGAAGGVLGRLGLEGRAGFSRRHILCVTESPPEQPNRSSDGAPV